METPDAVAGRLELDLNELTPAAREWLLGAAAATGEPVAVVIRRTLDGAVALELEAIEFEDAEGGAR
jgi:hypothetical protein